MREWHRRRPHRSALSRRLTEGRRRSSRQVHGGAGRASR